MKFLICGLGSIGQRHVRLLKEIDPNVEIDVYRKRKLGLLINDDLSVEHNVDLESHYNIHAIYSLEEALGNDYDAVFITNPISFHIEYAQKIANSGHNIFIEKPVGNTLKGTKQFLKTIKSKKLTTFVGYQMRFHPAVIKLRDIIKNQELGHVISADTHFGEWLPGMHDYEDYRLTHMARDNQGGGAILALSHEIDYAVWLFGFPKSVYAIGNHYTDLEIDVEDSADIMLKVPSPIGDVSIRCHVDFIQSPPERFCHIIFEYGTVKWDYFENIVHVFNSKNKIKESFKFSEFKRNDMFNDELKHFISCLEVGGKPMVSILNGVDLLKVCVAAKDSIKTGKVVVI